MRSFDQVHKFNDRKMSKFTIIGRPEGRCLRGLNEDRIEGRKNPLWMMAVDTAYFDAIEGREIVHRTFTFRHDSTDDVSPEVTDLRHELRTNVNRGAHHQRWDGGKCLVQPTVLEVVCHRSRDAHSEEGFHRHKESVLRHEWVQNGGREAGAKVNMNVLVVSERKNI